MALSAQTGYIMPREYGIYYAGPGTILNNNNNNINKTIKTSTQLNNETIQYTKKIINTLRPGLSGDDYLATIRLIYSQMLISIAETTHRPMDNIL